MLRTLLLISIGLWSSTMTAQDNELFFEHSSKNMCRSSEDLQLDSIITESISIDFVTMDTLEFRSSVLFYYDWDRPLYNSYSISYDFNKTERTTVTYNDENFWTNRRYEIYDESTDEWVLHRNIERIYEMGLLTDHITLYYENDEIKSGIKTSYEYNQEGNITFSRSFFYESSIGEFELSGFSIYEYDATGDSYKISFKAGDDINLPVIGELIYQLENGVESSYTSYNWDLTLLEFVPTIRVTYVLDSSGNRLERKFERYSDEEWTNSSNYIYDRMDCGRLLSSTYYSWNSNILDYELVSISTYYYSGLSSTTELESETVAIFPNPSMDKVTIQLPTDVRIQEVNILNASGQTVLKMNGGDSRTIDLSERTAGWYFFQAISDDKMYTGKFLKL